MEAEIIIKLFYKSNLAYIKSVPIGEIVFDDRAIHMCKFGCKNFNRKYSCPPASLNKKKWILRNYNIAILFATTFKFPSNSTRFQIRGYNYQKEYELQRISLSIDDIFRMNNIDHYVLSGGSCKQCKQCSYLDNDKCKKPDRKQVSMEATGIDCQITMHNAGFDFHMPNTDSINRCGCIFLNDERYLDLKLKKKESYQTFYKPNKKDVINMCNKLQLDYPKLFKRIDLIEIPEIKKGNRICNIDCSHYKRNFSCPPYSNIIDLDLWDYAILWEWKENEYKKYRYNQALKILHGGFYSLGFYFALSMRDCFCDECKKCTYFKKEKSMCNYRKILAPSLQSQRIPLEQFGQGKFGIELL